MMRICSDAYTSTKKFIQTNKRIVNEKDDKKKRFIHKMREQRREEDGEEEP